MDFSRIYDPECEAKVIRCLKGYEKDEIEDFIDDEYTGYVVQLNPNSSHYDSVLDKLLNLNYWCRIIHDEIGRVLG